MMGVAGTTASDHETSTPPGVFVTVYGTVVPFIVRTIVLVFTLVSRLAMDAKVVSDIPDSLRLVLGVGEAKASTGRKVPGSGAATKTM